ncbi:EpsG family protein [Cytobacillus kochii]|uniref:EpsG family protein n=1 Tax=Cytobacillus TaxID=2675230 RepID=UPI00278465A8|nr:EpsG family protein [Cytobacillus kochii]MDQ0187218.1 transmembrane protein EpsG [Cytobacillus kochii]MED1604057.1 EpsG family protein [Cytobacillus kochii]
MTVFWMCLFASFSVALIARYFSRPVLVGDSVQTVYPNKLMITFVAFILIAVSGARTNIGDTFFYMHAYEVNDFSWATIVEGKDIGFGLLQMVLKFYTDDPQVLIFVVSLLTNSLIVFVLAHYARLFELSIYIYITGGLFLVTMNGIRQCLAAAIVFAATKFLINGNWPVYFLFVILASSIHQSALILLPIYFFVRYKAWSKATLILLLIAVLIVVGFNEFSTLLFSAIEDTQYGQYAEFQEGGANILRVAVEATPLFIAYLGREKLRTIFPKSDFIVNMALVGLVFMIISTQNWIFARFSIYFSLYQLILVAWIVKLFQPKDQRFIYYCILVLYFFYYFYETVISLNIQYQSDWLG